MLDLQVRYDLTAAAAASTATSTTTARIIHGLGVAIDVLDRYRARALTKGLHIQEMIAAGPLRYRSLTELG
jgi:hypothetical protein